MGSEMERMIRGGRYELDKVSGVGNGGGRGWSVERIEVERRVRREVGLGLRS
jgi:hypothetical protein